MTDQLGRNGELPLESVGRRLRLAREAAGLSLADISARTKISERHLGAIEEDRFSDLAGRTYAVGFSRTYARSVGLDENEIADGVREALAAEQTWPTPQLETFEPGDPARIPSSRIAWIAGLGVVAVLAYLLIFQTSFLSPGASLPDLTEEPVAENGAAKPPASEQEAPPDQSGPVVFTALEDKIWVKFYDASGRQLFQKQMALGESYTVPADADGPQIWTGRPDAFAITIGGKDVPKLAETETTVKDQPISAKALLARGQAEQAGSEATELQAVQAAPSPASSTAPRTVRRSAVKAQKASAAAPAAPAQVPPKSPVPAPTGSAPQPKPAPAVPVQSAPSVTVSPASTTSGVTQTSGSAPAKPAEPAQAPPAEASGDSD